MFNKIKANGRKPLTLFLLLGFLLSLPAISAATMMPPVDLNDIATVQISWEQDNGAYQYDYCFVSKYEWVFEVGFSNNPGNSPLAVTPGDVPMGSYDMGMTVDVNDTSTYVNQFYLSPEGALHISAIYSEQLTEQVLLARGTGGKIANATVTYPEPVLQQVPEPGVLLLFGSGLVSLALFRRKRNK